MNTPLTENEREIALSVAEREGGETRKWLNLVLEAYDGLQEERDRRGQLLARVWNSDCSDITEAEADEIQGIVDAALVSLPETSAPQAGNREDAT